ncbi:coproporphyrinogen III oxidase [Parageobacillus caldoxylosilyticus]|uniref:Heme chaperone HemW n=1 Tax=Parageobacillus caldoxylosilyticus NBRC 107762 TaxID=1220594 RepID=A0A023DAL6_9BACL|nr:coproporphyrinogen III oxidase [Parageobacillus caldoxylosilyticus]BDG40633.1 coproporphyrinogen III oxidase [Parageobacillus caldoxylosilyticus]BDG44384.1 coproporphyrinogen III oxidase [Parageobacillus caldoxylosilyticus]GAJ38127.1 oxygen-independent coproporphyrinogen III oxidase [Parageobacillus caldoxylosilyticus NBRC 107762]
MKSAYFHIPFCAQICYYCDFNKVFFQGQPVDEYLQAMEREMKKTVEVFPAERLDTLFVGGGTPTVLEMKQLDFLLESIYKHFRFSKDEVEFTFEANPNELSKEKLQLLKAAGVNRLSFGVQTFHDSLLKTIGRTHRYGDVMRTISLAKEAGFDNISIDLMYGLPNQTLQQFQEDLEIAFSLDIQHISAYSLIIEPKTIFYNLWRKGTLPLPSEEEEAEMYEEAMRQMELHGYQQYEISNYARPGFQSRHNLTYWNNEEYYGIGAGAHSYVDGVRRVNIGPIKQYIAKVQETGLPYREVHRVTWMEQMEEEMFLGLRKTEGVSKRRFSEKFGRDMHDVFGAAIRAERQKGLLEETDTHVRLTRRGRLLGNEVFQAFLTGM